MTELVELLDLFFPRPRIGYFSDLFLKQIFKLSQLDYFSRAQSERVHRSESRRLEVEGMSSF